MSINTRIVIKTAMISFGVFFILNSIFIYFFINKSEPENIKTVQVISAKSAIIAGDIISEDMLATKRIRAEDKSGSFVVDKSKVVGTKATVNISEGEYLRSQEFIEKDKWYTDDFRTIILSAEVEERLANLIKKGSLIDIKVNAKDTKSIPKIVLSKIKVEDIIDENGVSIGINGVNKKAFFKLILDEKQRDRIYVAKDMGKIIYELYCDPNQKSRDEEFKIPESYFSGLKR